MTKAERLQDKVALITGNGSGIGAATSPLFASNGAKVMMTGDKEDSIKEVARDIEKINGIANYAILDISKEA